MLDAHDIRFQHSCGSRTVKLCARASAYNRARRYRRAGMTPTVGADDQTLLTRVSAGALEFVRSWEMDGLCVEGVCLPQSQRYARRAGVCRDST